MNSKDDNKGDGDDDDDDSGTSDTDSNATDDDKKEFYNNKTNVTEDILSLARNKEIEKVPFLYRRPSNKTPVY